MFAQMHLMKTSIKYVMLASLFLGFIFSSLPGMAEGEKWKYFATSEDRTKHYYDQGSIEFISDKVVRVWDKTTTSEAAGALTTDLKILREIDISKRKHRVLAMRAEFRDGSEKEQSFPNPRWGDIARNTWLNSLYEILCKKKK